MPAPHLPRFIFAAAAAGTCVVVGAWLSPFQPTQNTTAPETSAPAANIVSGTALPNIARPSASRASAPPPQAANADDTCAQLLALPANERLAAVTAQLIADADDPARARELALHLCASDPDFMREHGTILLAVLVESGAPAAAVQFAAAGGPERETWLDTAFSRWAQLAPEAATRAAEARADGAGFSAAVATWAQREPAALAEFARKNLTGTRQALAWEYVFATWLERDHPAAAAWLARFDAGPASDGPPHPRFAFSDHP